MNDDLQSYIEPELEARIVALVLGEASAFEAEEMERLMEEMPELRSYREGVGKVHGLVGEAHREQEDEEWRLSDERRGNLFSKIEEKKRGYEALIEKQREKRISRQGLIYLCAACLMIMLVMLMLMQLGKDRGMKTEMAFVDKESPADALARLDEVILGQSDFVQENRKDLTVGTQELSANQTKANYEESRARLGEMKLARVKVLGGMEPSSVLVRKPAAPSLILTAATALAAIDAEIPSVKNEENGLSADGVFTARDRSAFSLEKNAAIIEDRFATVEAAEKDGYSFRNSSNNQKTDTARRAPAREAGEKDLGVDTEWPAKVDHDGEGLVARSKSSAVAKVPTVSDIAPSFATVDPVERSLDLLDMGVSLEIQPEGGEQWDSGVIESPGSGRESGRTTRLSESLLAEEVRMTPGQGDSPGSDGKDAQSRWGREFDEEKPSGQVSQPLSMEADSLSVLPKQPPGESFKNGSAGTKAEPQRVDLGRVTTRGQQLPSKEVTKDRMLRKEIPTLAAKDKKEVLLEKASEADSFSSGGTQVNGGGGGGAGGNLVDQERIRGDFSVQLAESPESMTGPKVMAELRSGQRVKVPASRELNGKGGYRDVEQGLKIPSGESGSKSIPAKKRKADGERDLVEDEKKSGGKEMRLGNGDKGQRLLTEVEGEIFDGSEGKKSLEALIDPIRTNERIATGAFKDVDKVRRDFYKGEGGDDLGLYDKAEEKFKEVLRTDSANKAAFRWMERVSAVKSDYFQSDYNQTRAELQNKVDDGRELSSAMKNIGGASVEDEADPFGFEGQDDLTTGDGSPDPFDSGRHERPEKESMGFGDITAIPLYTNAEFDDYGGEIRTKATVAKMNQIILPEFSLENTTVEDALAKIEEKTRELDPTSLNPIDAGLKFHVEIPRITFNEEGADEGGGERVDSSKTKIKKLNLKNVPVGVALQHLADEANLKFRVEPDGQVTMFPIGSEDLMQRRWDVPPGLLGWLNQRGGGNESIVTTLTKNGISFPPNTKAGYLADQNTLVVRNTPTNLELIDGMILAFGNELKVREMKKEEAEKLKRARVNFETLVSEKSDSTFSLNVSDVSFKLAKAGLAKGNWPDASQVRPEEFVNALDYDDTKPSQSEKVACAIEQGAHPFMQQRNLMRIAMSTASLGRNASTPLRLTILLDQSGSMERSDRAESVKRAFALLASQLNANDEVTLVGFARTPRLLAERVKGNEAMKLAKIVENPLTEGGTNLEAALSSGLQLAKQQFIEGAQNRIILLTDGAANLGDALPENLARQVQMMRKHKIAFDTCGVGADGLNDEVLTSLAKQGDGRYYFLDRPEDADDGFAKRIAGALRPAAKNVKVQILFNPERVSKFKLYGFEKHKLKKEDFRNDSVDAAEMAEEESGVALYHFEPIADGRGDIGTVSVRFLDAATNEMVERTWAISYQPEAPLFSQAEPALRLASVAGLFAEKLKGSPVGERVDLKRLRQETELLKPNFDLQPRFHEFKIMLRQAGD